MANFLVTGASGFIGTWVIKHLLDQNHQVTALDQEPGNELWSRVLGKQAESFLFATTNLTSPNDLAELIKRNDIEFIVHLAALLTPACQNDPWLGLQTNVVGSAALFEAARQTRKVKAISYTSSSAVYGEGRDQRESPPMFYGAFKQSVDLIAEQYWLHENLRSIAIRPHVVYGPERQTGLTAGPSLAARAAVLQKPYCIGYTGIAGYDFVEDVANGLVRGAIECPPGATVVDMPSQQAFPEDLVKTMETILLGSENLISIQGPQLPISRPFRPNYLETVFPDFQPITLREGLRKTIDYYQDPSWIG